MNSMNYRGYTARIDFDDRDNIFVGRVLGLPATVKISFHGETVAEPSESRGQVLQPRKAGVRSCNHANGPYRTEPGACRDGGRSGD